MTNKRKAILTAILAVVFAVVAAMPVMAQNEKAADAAVTTTAAKRNHSSPGYSEIVVINNSAMRVKVQVIDSDTWDVLEDMIVYTKKPVTFVVPNGDYVIPIEQGYLKLSELSDVRATVMIEKSLSQSRSLDVTLQKTVALENSGKRVAAGAKNKNFDFSATFMGSWFPFVGDLATVTGGSTFEKSDIDFGHENFGLSAIVNMKFFKDYGAYFGLSIDDPTFEKAVEYLGYLNIKGMLLKFDYYTFGGTTRWNGEPEYPDPRLDNIKNFRAEWNTFSLLYNIAHGWYTDHSLWKEYPVLALGLFYGNTELPHEFHTKDETNKKYGLGWNSSDFFGLTILLDLLHEELLIPIGAERSGLEGWLFLNLFLGFGSAEGDKDALKKMNEVNGTDVSAKDVDLAMGGFLLRTDLILGVNKRWQISSLAEFCLGGGVELKLDLCSIFMYSVGLTARAGIKF